MDRVYRAIADPTRRTILRLLREREMTAGELAEHFDLTKPTLSKHFSVLREAGLVSGHKSGRHITYRLNPELLENALASLMEDYQFVWTPPIDVEPAARAFIELLVKGDFGAVVQEFDESVAALAKPEKPRANWEMVVGKYGRFVKQLDVRTEANWKYTSVIVSCQFERFMLGIKVVYMRSGHVGGLWFVDQE